MSAYSRLSEKAKQNARKRTALWREANREQVRQNQASWYQKNMERVATKSMEFYNSNKDKIKEDYHTRKDKRPIYDLLRDAKRRAKIKGLPCLILEEEISVPDVCPVLGLKLQRGRGKSEPSSLSLDKIIPSLGYVKGNVQVISAKANRMKNDATPEELRMFAKWVLKTFPEEPDAQT